MINDSNNPLNNVQPLSLNSKLEAKNYPKDSLPPLIKDAVDEVYDFVKAPYPMIASAALGAISLALQSKYLVQRDTNLVGPCSTFFLTIADSGERKSTCDHFFTKAIHAYEAEQTEIFKPILKKYEADLMKWEAKVSGKKEVIRQLAKGEPNSEKANSSYHERMLSELMDEKPERPKVPRLIYSDATPEALAFSLYSKWPSGSIISSEAGIVFGSHAMNKDAIMRNLGMLNTLWDGGTLHIDRRTSDSFAVRGASLSISLQIQEPTLREFFNGNEALARGTGFLARFLLAWPESTQGSRFFSDSPKDWTKVNRFNSAISTALNEPYYFNQAGLLAQKTIPLSQSAKDLWRLFHDRIEVMLRPGGDLTDVRDVASKSADNSVRLAALFQLFCEPDSLEVHPEYFQMASEITYWHLNESRRFFGEFALTPEMAKANQLDAWVIRYCVSHGVEYISKSRLMQTGPNQLRKKDVLEKVIQALMDRKRVALCDLGGHQSIFLNPRLIRAVD
jgi:putative DNA primase/helicase